MPPRPPRRSSPARTTPALAAAVAGSARPAQAAAREGEWKGRKIAKGLRAIPPAELLALAAASAPASAASSSSSSAASSSFFSTAAWLITPSDAAALVGRVAAAASAAPVPPLAVLSWQPSASALALAAAARWQALFEDPRQRQQAEVDEAVRQVERLSEALVLFFR